MRKMQIIIITAAGLASFAGAFGFTWFLKQQSAAAAAAATPVEPSPAAPMDISGSDRAVDSFRPDADAALKTTMREEELKGLIFEIREKMKEYKAKERFLAEEEQRILSARKTLEEDITRLSELHDALNVVVGRLKQQEENLKNRILEISAVEKGNLQRIAATYDKMDVTQSSKIIINMASTKQLEDAVKIIHLMSERTAAKLLGEISTTKPDLASLLSTELKRVKEGE
ncbi:MAG TPA: hypothetical protein P5279_03030 [Anaerohalosphaeraceae bacterium]|jgi:hypothetical protein|nr:hypothetical protein [Anaerohalosphaeraceae bacterium]HRT49443.1 hypothetical protein [Anaerohalosphaeraceae bacterium]HRT85393.1 hypothetical protein [Anaerohalosphaeraceae bacterium]